MGWWSRLRRTFDRGEHRAEIDEELQFHLDMEMASGRAPREARLRLGNSTRIAEETRAMGTIQWILSALQDARFGVRQIRRTPMLVLAVVLSLAIGIGANSAVFSLVDAALLRPLPVEDPSALRIVEWTNTEFPKGLTNINGSFGPYAGDRVKGSSVGPSLYRTMAREQSSVAAWIGAANTGSAAISLDGAPPDQLAPLYVSANFFDGLGIRPALGRPFLASEDRVGSETVIIVSHRYWKGRLGGREDALGKVLRINNVPARIVGVAPRDFFGLQPGLWIDVYAPLAARVAFSSAPGSTKPRGETNSDWWVRQIVRLKPGVAEETARAEVAALFRHVVAAQSAIESGSPVPELIFLPGARGLESLNSRDARALRIMLLLVGMLLLLVCANVANLLLSRSVGRMHESSVRLALGASAGRVFRQHLIESAVLAIPGGAVGLALGITLAQTIHYLFQAGRDASNAFALSLDLRTLAFAAAICASATFLFGLAPALRAARSGTRNALQTQSRSIAAGRLRLPRLLVAFQLALCLTALVAGGLLIRSLDNLQNVDIGFDRENLAYITVNPSQAGYTAERTALYTEQALRALAQVPGVTRASTVEIRPLSGNANAMGIKIGGREPTLASGVFDPKALSLVNAAGPGYFETMGIPLVAGRSFGERDFLPNSGKLVVDERFARHFFPNENAVGQRFHLGRPDEPDSEIVGVVGNSAYNSLRDEAFPTLFSPYRPEAVVNFVIRTTGDPAQLAEAVGRALAGVDATLPVSQFHTQTGLINRLLRTEWMLSFLAGAFGIIAVLLAAIGLAGLLAYAISRRTREIGVRMALGASAQNTVRMVLADSLKLAAVGVLLGLPCAFAVGALLKSFLYNLQPLDPATAALALAGVVAIALAAACGPAVRAANINPNNALREE